MPHVKITAGNYANVEAAQGFSTYSGDTPPKGVYRFKTGRWELTDNSSGDQMFKIVFEIDEPAGSPKSKYNGYALWHNANITQQGAPYLNAMLDALHLNRRALWEDADGGVVTFKDKPTIVKKIGTKEVKGLTALITTTRENWPKGSDDWRLKAVAFAGVEAATARGEVDPDADEPVNTPDADPDAVDDGDDGDAF